MVYDIRHQPQRVMDVVGRLKVSQSQNIYDADFEYSPQPLRWDTLTANGGTIVHLPTQGGVQLAVTTAAGSLAIRQSRPYHRYQPGKTMYMASGTVFGAPLTNNRQRVGFFDDGNGAFFEQGDPTAANPTGMGVVIRTDVGGLPSDTRIDLPQWNGDRDLISSINWTRIQMIWIEFAWYGAGIIRFGVMIGGIPHIVHQHDVGNRPSQVTPWARTGNLPTRYELRNVGVISAPDNLTHYGVSVLVEGRSDEQRGFTYTPGTAPGTTRNVALNTTRFPVLSVRMRPMGIVSETNTATGGSTTTLVRTGAGWTANQWVGRYCFLQSGPGAGQMARIVSNTTDTLTLIDAVQGGPLGVAAANTTGYIIGYPSRGQLLPRRLILSSSAFCTVELIQNAALTGANFQALSGLGSPNSFAERDVSATALTSGESVFAFTAPSGGSGLLDLPIDQLFPLFNNIRGTSPDVLTVAVTTPAAAAANVAAHIVHQEAMS